MINSIAAPAPTFPAAPEENILYFVENHSPKLSPWQRELVRIVRKLAQYLSPRLICEFRLFAIADHTGNPALEIDSIHDSGVTYSLECAP